jgi:TRAP-type C4-dicarboxylate transport system substrate-binding protein
MRILSRSLSAVAAASLCAVTLSAHAEKWDMPMAYAATNYHSETGTEFAKCVTTGTVGDIEIVTHPSGSLFKGNDITRLTYSALIHS